MQTHGLNPCKLTGWTHLSNEAHKMISKRIMRLLIPLVAFGFSSCAYAEVIWIDVRSMAEHVIDHIDGDVRISYDQILHAANVLMPDKNTEIHLYCRSGKRAAKAMLALQDAGYNNVSNNGSISDTRKTRGLKE